jgi:Protein of unknown function (DUF3306)
MSDSETFLSRWLRLKRESEASLPPADAPSPAAFDPASLPPIESIVADSDIRQFLHEGVPPELTRAALRSAWSADPAIRDFVGIAENQWNFNDHNGIPGFGPLEAPDLVARALGSVTNVAQEITQDAESPDQSALQGNDELEAAKLAAAPPIIGKTAGAVETAGAEKAGGVGEKAGVGEAGGGETRSGAAAPRTHGGALPQ